MPRWLIAFFCLALIPAWSDLEALGQDQIKAEPGRRREGERVRCRAPAALDEPPRPSGVTRQRPTRRPRHGGGSWAHRRADAGVDLPYQSPWSRPKGREDALGAPPERPTVIPESSAAPGRWREPARGPDEGVLLEGHTVPDRRSHVEIAHARATGPKPLRGQDGLELADLVRVGGREDQTRAHGRTSTRP